MCLTEYNEAEVMEMFREEGREEGWKEGWKDGREEGEENASAMAIKSIMANLKMTIDQAMDVLNIPSDRRPLYRGLVIGDQGLGIKY